MNSIVLNGGVLNSSIVNVVVGILSAGLFALSPVSEASVRVYGGSTGTIGTVANAYGYQRHNAVLSSGTAATAATSNGIRQVIFASGYNFFNTVGSAYANIIAYGGSYNTIETSGVITPHYLLVPVSTNSGSMDVTGTVDGYPIKFRYGSPVTISLDGYFAIPNIRSVGDIYFVSSLNGYCIPANHLGYGSPGVLEVAVTCDGTRIAPSILQPGFLSSTGNNPSYYHTVTIEENVFLETSGTINVNIRPNDIYAIWYYESSSELKITGSALESLVYKIPELSEVFFAVSFDTVAVRQATAFLYPCEVRLTSSPLDIIRTAGLLALPGYIRTTGFPVSGDVRKKEPMNIVTSLNGTLFAETVIPAYTQFTSGIEGLSLSSHVVIKPPNLREGVSYVSGTANADRIVLGENFGTTEIAGVLVERIYKHATFSIGDTSFTGTLTPLVMFTVVHSSSTLSGYLYTLSRVVGRSFGSVNIRGRTNPITNLFARADETRQVIIPPSPYAGTNSLHYVLLEGDNEILTTQITG